MLFLENSKESNDKWIVHVTSVHLYLNAIIINGEFHITDSNDSEKTLLNIYEYIRDGILDTDEFIITLDELLDICTEEEEDNNTKSSCKIIPFKKE